MRHQASICLSASFKNEMVSLSDKPLTQVIFRIIKSKQTSEGCNVNGAEQWRFADPTHFERIGIVSADDEDLSFPSRRFAFVRELQCFCSEQAQDAQKLPI